MLQASPAYSPLMGHASAHTLQRLQPSASLYMELVAVTPGVPASSSSCSDGDDATDSHQATSATPGKAAAPAQAAPQAPLLYLWLLTRQGEGSAWCSCWMTDAVRPLGAAPPSSTHATSTP